MKDQSQLMNNFEESQTEFVVTARQMNNQDFINLTTTE